MMSNFSIKDVWKKIDSSIISQDIFSLYRFFLWAGHIFKSNVLKFFNFFKKTLAP